MSNPEPCRHALHPWGSPMAFGWSWEPSTECYYESSRDSMRGKPPVDLLFFPLKVDGNMEAGDAGSYGDD